MTGRVQKVVGSLRAHQWFILLVVACVLIAGIDWGLPNFERSDLLSSPSGLGDSLLTELDTAVGSYFSTRDAADKRAVQALRTGNVPTPYAAPRVPAVLDRTERLQAVRRYVVSSCATDERETYIALARMKPAHLDLNPRGFMYGGAYLYPVGATLAFLQTLKVIHPTSLLSDNLSHPDLMRRIYVSGRSLSLLAFLGVMVLLAQLGTRMDRVLTGTFAMVAWSCSTLALNQSLVTKPHVWAAFWALASIQLTVRHLSSGRFRDLALGAVALGIAMGSSLFAAVLLVLYPTLLSGGADGRPRVRPMLLAIPLVVVSFLVSNPYVLIDPAPYGVTIAHHGDASQLGYAAAGLQKALRFASDYLLRGLPFPMGLAAAAGITYFAVRGGGLWRRMAILTGLVFSVLALFLSVPRIALFLGPILCLFAGKVIASLTARLRLAGLAVVVPGVVFFSLFAYDTIRDDAAHAPTARWLHECAGDTPLSVGVFDRPEPRNLPPMPFMRLHMVNLAEYRGGADDPRFVILGNYADDRGQWRAHPLESGYSLRYVLGYRPSLDWFASIRSRSESRLAAWVYEKSGDHLTQTDGTGGSLK